MENTVNSLVEIEPLIHLYGIYFILFGELLQELVCIVRNEENEHVLKRIGKDNPDPVLILHSLIYSGAGKPSDGIQQKKNTSLFRMGWFA